MMKNLLKIAAALFALVMVGCGGKDDPKISTPAIVTPVPETPAEGANDVAILATFSWETSGEGALYTVSLSDDEGATWTVLATDLGETTYTVTAEQILTPLTDYQWKVAASLGEETLECNPISFATAALNDGDAIVLYDSPKSSPFNIYITGDGFTQEDWNSGFFIETVNGIMAYFFAIEPYKSYKEYFEITLVTAVSNVQGIAGGAKDTKFKSYENGTVVFPQSNKAIYDFIIENVPGVASISQENSMVVMLSHSSAYGGGVIRTEDSPVLSLQAFQNNVGQIFNHESGHGVAVLADEYAKMDMEIPQYAIDPVLAERNGDPWSARANVDFGGDETQCLWAQYIGMPGYEDVGYFEGGHNFTQGVWRSTERSIMMNDMTLGFNVACRETIVRKLMKVAGEEFVWEDFLAKDDNTAPVYPTEE